ncbi:MAG: Ig-like domain-containing protein, partial [Isosphaeraceae bacterium]
MGSFSGKGRGRGPARRRNGPEGHRGHRPDLESLEDRRLLTQANPLWNPGNSNIADVVRGPLANAGDTLINVYQSYQTYLQGGQQGGFAQSNLNSYKGVIYFSGDSVGVSVRAGNNADFIATVTSLKGAGLVVGGTDAFNRVIEGQVPISKLPTVAALPGVLGVHPLWAPITYNQGSANNQGEQAMKADVAKNQFGVNGAGVTVGVISNSISRFNGGLPDSVATGDLPPSVNVLADSTFDPATYPSFNTDEGRAMLEQIYDIAPGANLAFHTNLPPDPNAPGGQTAMATAVRALANQGRSNIIVDDVGFPDEPYYQDGIVAQAITDVTRNNGVVYFSSAGNSADHGFESPFRGTSASIPGALGAGRYMDFDPGPGVSTTLDVTVNAPGLFVMNFDQPIGNVTSDVNVYFLDASGNVVNDFTGGAPASGTTNNIAQGQPQEIFRTPAPGTYRLVVSVQPGSADVGRISMYEVGSDLTFSKQYGNAGGITYPTTFGHPTSDDAIGVGAVPFWVVNPFQPFNPTPSEGFSSFGPSYKVFNADGSRKATVQVQNKPDLSGIDGVNTSFFGFDIDTTNPPLTTGPATTVNQDPDTLPNFFGTSSSAPNLAAVGALMKQLSPNATTSDIRNAMISSAIPLNGQAQGTFNAQGGFGLVQAPAALAAVDTMRVVSTLPSAGQTVFTAPQYLFVSFSHPINPATLQASDLEVFSPPGTFVTVGNPIFNPAMSSSGVAFPLTFNNSPGVVANGVFSYRFKDGVITSTDGRPLVGYNGAFLLNDVSAPRVTNTAFNGRIVTVDFSEPLKASTVTPGSVLLVRTGSSGVFNNPTNVIVSTLPGAGFNYDAANNRVVIDLSGVSQANLPSDTYALVVDDQVTDLAGNKLDGEFSGVFPSGNGQPGGTFVQAL